ncbi:MAG: Gp15 family bacteriophage protein [Veillonella parvula]
MCFTLSQRLIPQKSESEPVFSYTEDASCIFAAFLEYYGIDLERVRYMHWWKFLILFEGLPEQAEIKQRMMYRKADLNSIKDKEERKRVKRSRNGSRSTEEGRKRIRL